MSLEPEYPEEAGVTDTQADTAHIEGAHVLVDEAWPTLESRGFTRDEGLRWAEAYLEAEGSGDVETFLAWISEQEGTDRS